MRPGYIAVTLFMFLFISIPAGWNSASAVSLDDLSSAVAAYERSKICPARVRYHIHEYSVFCKEWCDQSRVCSNNPSAPENPCLLGDREKCHSLAVGGSE